MGGTEGETERKSEKGGERETHISYRMLIKEA
jgi:hypothetical protein